MAPQCKELCYAAKVACCSFSYNPMDMRSVVCSGMLDPKYKAVDLAEEEVEEYYIYKAMGCGYPLVDPTTLGKDGFDLPAGNCVMQRAGQGLECADRENMVVSSE